VHLLDNVGTLTVHRDLTITDELDLFGATLTVFGKLTVEGTLRNCGNISCESLEITDTGTLDTNEGAIISVEGGCKIKGVLRDAKTLNCGDLVVSGCGQLKLGERYQIKAEDFDFSSSQTSTCFLDESGTITVTGDVDIDGIQFQHKGTFVIDSWFQKIRMSNEDSNYFENLVLARGYILTYNKEKDRFEYDNWDSGNKFVAHNFTYSLLDADAFNIMYDMRAIFDSNGKVIKPMLNSSGEVDEAAYEQNVCNTYLYGPDAVVPVTYDLTMSNTHGVASAYIAEAKQAIGQVLTELDLSMLDDRDTSWESSFMVYLHVDTYGSERTVTVNGHKWVVRYNGLNMKISPKKTSDRSEVEWYNGWAECASLGVKVDYNATTTQDRLNAAAASIAQVAREELESILEDLVDDVLDDAFDLLETACAIDAKQYDPRRLEDIKKYGMIEKAQEYKDAFEEMQDRYQKVKKAYDLMEELYEFGLNAPFKPN